MTAAERREAARLRSERYRRARDGNPTEARDKSRALRHDRIEAPWVLNGPINAEAFKTYVRVELIKTLKPNDIVVLDNLNSHKGKAVRAMVRSIGARLFFLPSYSPDLKPPLATPPICA